jgi:hypothetical protein
MVVILLSNSIIYVVQRNSDERRLLYLCHVTYKILPSDNCTSFDAVFLFRMNNTQSFRLVVICGKQNTIIEYIMSNPFSVQYSRRYPLYDY